MLSNIILLLTPTLTTPGHAHYSQGAMSIDEEEQQKKKEKSAAFQGSGFKLGDSEGPSVQIRGRARDQSSEKVTSASTIVSVQAFTTCRLYNVSVSVDRKFVLKASLCFQLLYTLLIACTGV